MPECQYCGWELVDSVYVLVVEGSPNGETVQKFCSWNCAQDWFLGIQKEES